MYPEREDTAVGSREPQGPARHVWPCAKCAHPTFFRDPLPLRRMRILCTECFVDEIETLPEHEKIRLLVTQNNMAEIVKLMAELKRKPS